MRKRSRKRIERWHRKFLETLAKVPSVTHACKSANVNRTTAYEHRNADKEFARRWQEALDASIDKVELRLFQLAAEGEPRLIEFLLRCHRPETYRDTRPHRHAVAPRLDRRAPKQDDRTGDRRSRASSLRPWREKRSLAATLAPGKLTEVSLNLERNFFVDHVFFAIRSECRAS